MSRDSKNSTDEADLKRRPYCIRCSRTGGKGCRREGDDVRLGSL